ncbi:MAG: sodium:proton antiporter [Frankiaceae bacterium]|nr:sodium:proton antiporter [Frankiaceae bacterium]MBV9869451.1 sodium:proton antiporter [Frankiaceae bacterium]
MPDHDAERDSDVAEDDEPTRGESEMERLDRNWEDLLQELRVSQTGVQLLTGFLLTLPFQQRFGQLDDRSRDVYLATVCCAITATASLIAPVAVHRMLFRQHAREAMVAAGHWCAVAGLAMLGLSVCGVVNVILTLVVSDTAGFIASGVSAVLYVLAWLVLPLLLREHSREITP